MPETVYGSAALHLDRGVVRRTNSSKVVTERRYGLHRLDCRLHHRFHPSRKIWIQAVIDPLPLPPIGYEPQFAQLPEVTGKMWLWRIDDPGQVTNTQLGVGMQQQYATQSRLVRQRGIEIGWRYIHFPEYT